MLATNCAMLHGFKRTGDPVTVGPADEDGIREATGFARSVA
jgi:hypothetical protein